MLPLIKTNMQSVDLLVTRWKSEIDPVLANPILSGFAISNITISSGSAAVVNHLLGRKQQGWFLIDVNSPATIARIAPLNDKTLTLSSDAAVTVAVWVF